MKKYEGFPLELLNCQKTEPPCMDPSEEERLTQAVLSVLKENSIKDGQVCFVRYTPSVVRIGLLPPRTIAASKFLELDGEFSLALGEGKVRVELDFEEGVIAVEIPRKDREIVNLGALLKEEPETQNKLLFAAGKNTYNENVYEDICKLPHLLIGGSTGAGKSVFLDTLLLALLYRYSPKDLRLLLIDPKCVEFSSYKGVPHLLTDPVTEYKDAVKALQWAALEMERRYRAMVALSKKGKRVYNIDEYNAAVPTDEEKFPRIVIVVDELSDLMLMGRREIESCIQMLTQKSRAAGIYLIVGTQRCSADVLSGVIKANIPSRIAFSVAGEADSRAILDTCGAENLLRNGDMLFITPGNSPRRIQSAYVSQEELLRAVEYVKANTSKADLIDLNEIEISKRNGRNEAESVVGKREVIVREEDELFIRAVEFVIQMQTASISMLQRKLAIGYTKAGKIVDLMEKLGYISPFDGTKARSIYITKEQFDEKYGKK